MESLSIQSYSAQLRIYSKGADPPKSTINKKEGETTPNTSSVSTDFQNQDGDSFSMSLEARIIQISVTHTDDGAATGNQPGGNLQVNSAQHKHQHPMGNPEDVASKVLQHLQQEHQESGESLQSFVNQVQNRMESRQAARSSKPDGFNEFRMQVDTLIVSGLNSWSQSGGQGINLQA